MGVVAYMRWSFARGSNCKALSGKILVFWIDGHLIMGGGRLQEVVAHGVSTVLICLSPPLIAYVGKCYRKYARQSCKLRWYTLGNNWNSKYK